MRPCRRNQQVKSPCCTETTVPAHIRSHLSHGGYTVTLHSPSGMSVCSRIHITRQPRSCASAARRSARHIRPQCPANNPCHHHPCPSAHTWPLVWSRDNGHRNRIQPLHAHGAQLCQHCRAGMLVAVAASAIHHHGVSYGGKLHALSLPHTTATAVKAGVEAGCMQSHRRTAASQRSAPAPVHTFVSAAVKARTQVHQDYKSQPVRQGRGWTDTAHGPASAASGAQATERLRQPPGKQSRPARLADPKIPRKRQERRHKASTRASGTASKLLSGDSGVSRPK